MMPSPAVLVLGATGMLGHVLLRRMGATGLSVRGTVRAPDPTHCGPLAQLVPACAVIPGVRAEDSDSVARALEESGATVVVNAIGVIKQSRVAADAPAMVRVNALFPHELAVACAARGVRLIHISTDCVYSGRRGGYDETDLPDPPDLYGRSKLLGEIEGRGVLTLRTSIIGRELSGARGLLEWFVAQDGGSARGFDKAVFSGLTTTALSDLIIAIIEAQPGLDGVWHASAAPIDKFALLVAARDALRLNVDVTRDSALVIDRSLNSTALRTRIGWHPPTWEQMLAELAADPTPNRRLRAC